MTLRPAHEPPLLRTPSAAPPAPPAPTPTPTPAPASAQASLVDGVGVRRAHRFGHGPTAGPGGWPARGAPLRAAAMTPVWPPPPALWPRPQRATTRVRSTPALLDRRDAEAAAAGRDARRLPSAPARRCATSPVSTAMAAPSPAAASRRVLSASHLWLAPVSAAAAGWPRHPPFVVRTASGCLTLSPAALVVRRSSLQSAPSLSARDHGDVRAGDDGGATESFADPEMRPWALRRYASALPFSLQAPGTAVDASPAPAAPAAAASTSRVATPLPLTAAANLLVHGSEPTAALPPLAAALMVTPPPSLAVCTSWGGPELTSPATTILEDASATLTDITDIEETAAPSFTKPVVARTAVVPAGAAAAAAAASEPTARSPLMVDEPVSEAVSPARSADATTVTGDDMVAWTPSPRQLSVYDTDRVVPPAIEGSCLPLTADALMDAVMPAMDAIDAQASEDNDSVGHVSLDPVRATVQREHRRHHRSPSRQRRHSPCRGHPDAWHPQDSRAASLSEAWPLLMGPSPYVSPAWRGRVQRRLADDETAADTDDDADSRPPTWWQTVVHGMCLC
ncbi:hypothetical protein CXG81DRAFT_19333 [Caulochytrium protostelioides]|uniref:Uncharacterized protein n=1 Tax=Caulochytrium protostelioides TaxID=1555241 RepID=A0A4P9X6F1_9FUNG|nr:hypothetical protein CXG81DRAFT_19333 [Caulochytrium protostelioides]|eukprot:RKP00754.1 hypothetical protein CXG81DRAFT_19333 [Caulochytrium protostelioides]